MSVNIRSTLKGSEEHSGDAEVSVLEDGEENGGHPDDSGPPAGQSMEPLPQKHTYHYCYSQFATISY